jgi:DNA mismatch repair ATPase MutS
MMNNREKRKREKLIQAFGKLKEDAFNFELIEKYYRKKDPSNAYQVINDKTCNDLDFQELFMFIDRTSSKIGQQFLYNRLRTINYDAESLSVHEQIIEEIGQNQNFRLDLQSRLSTLNSLDSYFISSLFQDEHIKAPTWFFVFRLLAFTSLLSILLLVFNPAVVFILFGVFAINLVLHYLNKRNLYQYLNSLPQLLRLNKVAQEFHRNETLRKINPELSQAISVLNKVRNRMFFFKLEVQLEGEFQALFWGILEFFKILFLLEPLLLFGVLRLLDTKRNEIEAVFSFVGEIDTLVSIASLRNGLDYYCKPEITPNAKNMVATEVFHPLIPGCVNNSIRVGGKSILLTGSNMSGKTSFIRTIAINALTGLTLNTCFARQFSMPVLRIYSAIRISDDLMNDRSYYFEEVITIKEMIGKSRNDNPNLFLLDEIFKGTNTVERISAGKAVLSSLAKADNIVFVSTHDIELADLLKDEYELYHFSEKVDNKTVDFDYKLKEGKLKNRNAIRILQINDYPAEIIDEAIELSKKLDQNSLA